MNGFDLARTITKKYAKSFYFASLFLKNDKKKAAYAVYALCRASDEAVDGNFCSRDLNDVERDIDSAYKNDPVKDPLLAAFQETIQKYQIPKVYFDTLLQGMRMDTHKRRYNDFMALQDYCYKVAGVVGLIMLQIFGYKGSQAKEHAINLGIAMQLTNILRDIKEDFGLGRIYLPKDELEHFKVTEADISMNRMTENFETLLKFQIVRAREFYAKSKSGINVIDDANARFAICAMADIYAGILDSIEQNHYDVFSRRAHVDAWGKVTTIFSVVYRGEYRK